MVLIRWFFIYVGIISLILAIIGIVLPLLPTTPLVILSAYCFSKGSPSLHRRLLSNRYFGPILQDWESYGVIRTRFKILATIMIAVLFSLSFFLANTRIIIKILLFCIALSVLFYIWSRPPCTIETETANNLSK